MLRGEMTQNGGWSLERSSMSLEGWGFEAAVTLGAGKGLKTEFHFMANNEVNHAYRIKFNKNSGHWSSVELRGWRTHHCARSMMHLLHRERAQSTGFESHPDLVIHILHNNSVIERTVLSDFCVVLVNNQPWRGHGKPWVCSQLGRDASGRGIPRAQLAPEVRAVLLGKVPSIMWDLGWLWVVSIMVVLQYTSWWQNSIPRHCHCIRQNEPGNMVYLQPGANGKRAF